MAASKKTYLVASDDGSWHYSPTVAETPEEAIFNSESEAGTVEQLGVTYLVYELATPNPVTVDTKVQLVRV